MELKEIKILLQRFFEGETLADEEKQLGDFFRNEEVPSELEIYRDFFTANQELSEQQFEGFEEDVMNHILESEHNEKNKFRWLWQTVTSVAAVLLIALLVINFNQDKNQFKDTYDDPNIAYTEATNVLRYMASKYQKGMIQLQPIAKLDKASASMKTGLTLVNKGFGEMDELTKMNKKLKKQ